MQTQVGIIGAGPAGLLLSHLLASHGIDSVVLENRSREYVENRVRAGVLEQRTVDLLIQAGLGDRLQQEGMQHHGIEIRFNNKAHRINFSELTDGKGITIYGQQEIVKDLINARLADGGEIKFNVSNVELKKLTSENPVIEYSVNTSTEKLNCDFIAGCDGFHGISRSSIPRGSIKSFDRTYPFAWLGVLVDAPPSSDVLIYANSPDGFALHSMRSPSITRNYIQCAPEDTLEEWSDDRVWQVLHDRLETIEDWKLTEGNILEKSITPMRSYVCETMRHGRLFLAGDAAHIVPPTGAKGMNLALADVNCLSAALNSWYETGSEGRLANYTENRLRHIWRGEHFSWYMTSLLHKLPDDAQFQARLQRAELEFLTQSNSASTALAENYVGVSFD